jgi:outer membrane protein assembly factor BamB
VYSADADGVVYALTTDGEKKWTVETEHNLHTKAVALNDGTLFVGTGGTMPAVVSGDTDKSRASLVLALDAETGEQKWQFKASDWFTGPTIGGNRVYAGNNNSTLYALDRATGEEVWSWQATGGSFLAPPTYANETVFAGIHGGGELVAFDAKTGSIRWRSDLNAGNVKSSPAVDGEQVYIGAARVRAVAAVGEAATGGTETTNENTPTSTPESGTTGILSAHSISDGEPVWQYETDHDFRSSPAVLTDTVYVGGGNGMVAVKRQTGKERWSVQFDGYVYSSPAVTNERAYIGSADGHLYCIGRAE